MEKNTVKVKIFGMEYKVRGDSEPGYIESLARMVDEKMRQLGQPGGVQTDKAAILAAFNMADELVKTRQLLEGERQRHDQSARLAASLDLKLQEALAAPASLPESGPPLALEEEEPLPSPGDPPGMNDEEIPR